MASCGVIAVLILVLMEDALRGKLFFQCGSIRGVLILVLMEDALRGKLFFQCGSIRGVLILVLMEDALRVSREVKISEVSGES